MDNIIRKLTSRKLWMAIAGVATGIAMILGVDSNDISTIAGGIVSLVSAIMYIVVEGKIDAERVKNAIEGTETVIETIEGVD